LKLLDLGHIAHAILDVFEQEPLAPSDAIWSNSNIAVLPHVSAPTNRYSSAKVIAENIKNYDENNIMPKFV